MSMKNYLMDSQMESFVMGVLLEFMKSEGYALSEIQQKAVLDKSLNILSQLGYSETIVIESEDKRDLAESINKLVGLTMYLFSLCVMHAAREEKYKEIILALEDKK
jgi:hypothetical protein